MTFAEYFPVWQQLTPEQQALLNGSVQPRHFPRGDVIHRSAMECTGLLLLRSGQLRAYILSEEGREITIYRLFDRDMCLFSAAWVFSLTSWASALPPRPWRSGFCSFL